MFGLGFGEVFLILAVALVVIGPKKLPEVAKLIGRGLAEFRRHADEVQRTIYREVHEPLKAADLQPMARAKTQAQPGPPPSEAPAAAGAYEEETVPAPPEGPAA
ncbi:MAG: twin-arginine translocase subunit TatB [Deltaproteobacteria bacterium]|nr:twin-arginine translocase subunit TatB [Deltaproteobacteria bacterium]